PPPGRGGLGPGPRADRPRDARPGGLRALSRGGPPRARGHDAPPGRRPWRRRHRPVWPIRTKLRALDDTPTSAPADGQVPVYESATDSFAWGDAAGGADRATVAVANRSGLT